jgi:2-dehydropantoate 2-reductase
MRTLILGAGAIGAYFGARLAQAGGDVTFLVRPGRRDVLRERGINVRSPFGDLHLAPKLVVREDLRERFDVIVLSCKAYDLAAAMTDVAPAVGGNSLVLPLLNGVRQIDILSARFASARVLGGIAQAALRVTPAGDVEHFNRVHRLIAGALDRRPAPLLLQLAQLMRASGVEFIVADDVEQAMWNKFVFWSALAGACCTLRASLGDVLQTVAGEAFVSGLFSECAEVAQACGHALSESQLATYRKQLSEPGSVLAASMWRDIERGSTTEAEHTLGDLVGRAESRGVASPCLRLAYSHLQAYELRRQTAQR